MCICVQSSITHSAPELWLEDLRSDTCTPKLNRNWGRNCLLTTRVKWNSHKSPLRTIFPAYTQRQSTPSAVRSLISSSAKLTGYLREVLDQSGILTVLLGHLCHCFFLISPPFGSASWVWPFLAIFICCLSVRPCILQIHAARTRRMIRSKLLKTNDVVTSRKTRLYLFNPLNPTFIE